MNEIRQKVNDTDSDISNYSNKRRQESTSGIVNEIKNKIQQFKEKKENEREISKNNNNELDIEVNKEFLNKFKRSKTSKELSNDKMPIELMKDKVLDLGENNHLKMKGLDTQPDAGEKEKQEKTSNYLKKFNLDLNITPATDENKHKVSNSLGGEIINLVSNKRSGKSFLMSNLNKPTSTSEDKKVVLENKKNDILESLSSTSKNKRTLNTSYHSNRSIDGEKKKGIKDKIKSFVFEIDNMKNKQQENNISVVNYNRQITSPSYNYDSNTSNSKPLSLKTLTYQPRTGSSKGKNYENDFAASFKTTTEKKTSIFEIESKKNKNENNSNFFGLNIVDKQEKSIDNSFPVTVNEVRKLNSKLRFMSNDEVKKMDEGLIDELITLSNTVSKVFEWKIKSREIKKY